MTIEGTLAELLEMQTTLYTYAYNFLLISFDPESGDKDVIYIWYRVQVNMQRTCLGSCLLRLERLPSE